MKGHGPPLNQACEALQLNITRWYFSYIFSAKVHPFTMASAGFESATLWLQVTYAWHSAKLTFVIVKRTFIDKCIFILHYVDNIVSKEIYHILLTLYTVWRVMHIYMGISISRWAPTSQIMQTVGVLVRAKISFWNETSFQDWFLLADLFYFYMYLPFSSMSFSPFPLFIFVSVFFFYFHIWFIFIISIFNIPIFAFRTSLAPTNTLNDKLDKW